MDDFQTEFEDGFDLEIEIIVEGKLESARVSVAYDNPKAALAALYKIVNEDDGAVFRNLAEQLGVIV